MSRMVRASASYCWRRPPAAGSAVLSNIRCRSKSASPVPENRIGPLPYCSRSLVNSGAVRPLVAAVIAFFVIVSVFLPLPPGIQAVASINDPELVRQLDRHVVVGFVVLRLVQVIALLVDLDDRATFVAFDHRAAEGVAVGQAAIESVAAMQGGDFILVGLVTLQNEHRSRA